MLVLVGVLPYNWISSVNPVLLAAFVVANVGVTHCRQFTGGIF
jgi:hypothetical protein